MTKNEVIEEIRKIITAHELAARERAEATGKALPYSEERKLAYDESMALARENGYVDRCADQLWLRAVEENERHNGRTIKQLRVEAGMTQAAFAQYFGLAKRTVEGYEHDRPCPEYLRSLIEYKLIHEGLIR